jgi:hypothetical protein
MLTLGNGGHVSLRDDSIPSATSSPSEPAAYSYFGQLHLLPFFLIHAQYSEGNAFLIVHARTGRLSGLQGYPQPSPDRRWLLVAENGYFNEIGVFLYAVAGDSLIPAYQLKPDNWVPGTVTWRSSSYVEVERVTGIEGQASDSTVGYLRLVLQPGGWRAVVR